MFKVGWWWWCDSLGLSKLWREILGYASLGALKNNPLRLSLRSLFGSAFSMIIGRLQSGKLSLEAML